MIGAALESHYQFERVEPRLFRLPGLGGAALTLRGTILADDSSGPRLALDIGLLCPQWHHISLARPVSADVVTRLSAFLMAAASEQHPEVTLPSLQDHTLGLELSVVSSDEREVGLNVSIVVDMEADVQEFDQLDFLTSRAALTQAGIDVRSLRGGDGLPDEDVAPPAEWGQ